MANTNVYEMPTKANDEEMSNIYSGITEKLRTTCKTSTRVLFCMLVVIMAVCLGTFLVAVVDLVSKERLGQQSENDGKEGFSADTTEQHLEDFSIFPHILSPVLYDIRSTCIRVCHDAIIATNIQHTSPMTTNLTYTPTMKISATTTDSGVYLTACPDTWIAYQGSCYLFDNHAMNWVTAERFCEQKSSHLVNIGDKNENSFINSIIAKIHGTVFWIGLTDESIEGIWIWFDTQEEIEFSNWGPTEPNSFRGTDEDCV